ncbi:MAG TPA: TIGR02221 family CRISPR-associated protein [Chitinispirillaceae bacterium]|nr:TIGR02221 family CRISPR-associated protein [Chitinispirillaceae bacterium]
MAKVFISFLGMGDYKPVRYDNGQLLETEYVQSAIVEKNGGGAFEKIRILATQGSSSKHWDKLRKRLAKIITVDVSCEMILIPDDLVNDQWKWFETVLSLVENGDTVWFDMTHGYRAFSIVLSAALSFIQKTKNIQLMAVYYGAHEAPGTPIIDMKGFYQINEWADGVAQLIDSADTSRLAALSEQTDVSTFSSLRDKNLISALNDLSQIIKNVDVNHIADKADQALTIIQGKLNVCSGADRQLLQMVTEKFTTLSQNCPVSGKYDIAYFTVQIAFVDMLNKHGLYMQSFTVLRECIGAIGMLGAKTKHNKNMDSDDGRKGRKYADVFINMINMKKIIGILKTIMSSGRSNCGPFMRTFHHLVY